MRTFHRGAAISCLALMSCSTAAVLLWHRTSAPLVRQLAAAVGSDLTIEPRLSGGFLPPTGSGVTRSGPPHAPTLSPDVRIAIARIEKAALAMEDTRSQAALGAALLIEGDVDRSIAVFEDVASFGEDADAMSDLAAAYLVKAKSTPARRLEYLVRGFDAASRSLRLRPSDEARFNKALAAEALAPYVNETDPWHEYVSAERDPRWVAVARARAGRGVPAADVRAKWEERRQALRVGLDDANRRLVEDTAADFPEALLDFFDQELLVDWARAEAAADRATATRHLSAARRVAEAISRVTRDALPLEEVDLITASVSAGGSSAGTRSLAQAHIAYARGLQQYDADDYKAADRSFGQALSLFAVRSSPYRHWAAVQQAIILFQRRDLEAADRQLAAVERAARNHLYGTLLGRTLWMRGLVHSKSWRLAESFDAFRQAASSFEAASEREYAVTIYSYLADALRTLGEFQSSWEYIGKTLEGLSRVRRATRRYLFLYNASLFASSQALIDGALLFQDAALREARSGITPFIVAEALVERGLLRNRSGDPDAAGRDADAAIEQIGRIPMGPGRQYGEAEAELLLSDLARMRGTAPRIDGVLRAIDFFKAAEPARVPRLFLALASAQSAVGNNVAVERALADGIDQLERRQSGLSDEALKISYFDEGWNLFPEMIGLQLSRGRAESAFEYAERSRGRLLAQSVGAASAGPLTLDHLRRALPESTAMLYYATLDDRLLIWIVARGGATLIQRRVARPDLARLVARHVAWLADHREGPSPANDALFETLVRPALSKIPAESTLTVVADGALQRLPFATLQRPDTGRYLIEDRAIVAAPSATLFLTGLARLRRSAPSDHRTALLVGNPYVDAAKSHLPPLPGADREATAAAAFYADPEVLTGRSATKRRFVEEAAGRDVVHFGGHAIVNVEYPLLSRLVFASGSGDAEPLFAHEISRLSFDRTRVVVLAACSTAAGAMSRGEGVVSIARPFLAAGVPVVIASQWDVDDRATERLFVAFHGALSATRDPAAALRIAQLSMIHNEDRTLADPGSWGGFVALGTAER